MRLEAAVEAFLSTLEERELAASTRRSYRSLLTRLLEWAQQEDISELQQLDATAIRRWLAGRGVASRTKRKEISLTKAFFSHTVREGWLPASPARTLRPPSPSESPTLPLHQEAMRHLLQAAEGHARERALLLLLRYSGLGIRDAATLSRSALRPDGLLVLRRAKTGELVTVPLPDVVVEALGDLPRRPGGHFFWTAQSQPETVAKYWRARLSRLAQRAGIPDFHPHRLRDTFAVELLLAHVSMEDVSTLLGHSSIRTTERHYAPWNAARNARLTQIVRAAQSQDPILAECALGRTAEAVTAAPAKESLVTPYQAVPTDLG